MFTINAIEPAKHPSAAAHHIMMNEQNVFEQPR